MRALHRRSGIVAVGLLLGSLGTAAHGQVVTADRLELAPTTSWLDGVISQDNDPIFHTWDPGAPFGPMNLFLGRRAGNVMNLSLNTGQRNTGFGAEVMHGVTSGGSNTAVGTDALYFLQDGSQNTAVGDSALLRTTSGYLNTAVGSGSLYSNTTGSYNVSVGGMVYNTTGSYNTSVGVTSLFQSSIGSGNTAVGFQALHNNTAGSTNTALGHAADVAKPDLVNATAIGAGAIATTKNMVRIGNSAVTLIQGQVPFSWVSDRRWKTDVEPLAMGLDFVRRLQPVSYRLKGGNGRLDMGFVAQDVEAVLGDTYNAVARGDDDEQLLSMRYTDLIAPLVRALQEVDARQSSDDEALAALRNENATLARQLEALRARLDSLAPQR